MPQRKSGRRLGQGCPASLSMAKSAEAEKAGATQHSPRQRSQSARRLRRRTSRSDDASSPYPDIVCRAYLVPRASSPGRPARTVRTAGSRAARSSSATGAPLSVEDHPDDPSFAGSDDGVGEAAAVLPCTHDSVVWAGVSSPKWDHNVGCLLYTSDAAEE